jgi:single-strand DNA-binding protein
MSGINKAIILGNLGGDPEIRRTQDGKPIANFNIATSEVWRDKSTGERKERTQWHRVVVFNENLCKIAEQYLKKGSKVYVEGQIETRKWTAQDGRENYTTEIVLRAFHSTLELCGDRRAGGPPQNDDFGRDGDRPRSPRNSGTYASASTRQEMDDDIPF